MYTTPYITTYMYSNDCIDRINTRCIRILKQIIVNSDDIIHISDAEHGTD